MPVHRKVTITVPVQLTEQPRGTSPTSGNLTYEPLDNGMVKVSCNFSRDAYLVDPKDLIELIVAVASGSLMKLPDMKRNFREAIGLTVAGDGVVVCDGD